MKSGRVARSVRQWGNFTFLMLLLGVVGWYSWKMSLQKVMVIPPGFVKVEVKESLLFWRKPHVAVKSAGKHAATPAEVKAIEEGALLLFPLGPVIYDVHGVVETSTTYEGLKAKVGLGHKSFVEFSGSLSMEVDQENLEKISSSEFTEEVKQAFQRAISRSSAHLRSEDVEKFKGQVSSELQEALGITHITPLLEDLDYKDEGSPGVTVTLQQSQLRPPTILEEMPASGYASIAMALFLTVFIYAFVRVVFAEVFGILFVLLVGIPLSAFGVERYVLHKPGHYQTRRRRTSNLDTAGIGMADMGGALLEAGSAAVDMIPHHHGLDLGDAVDVASSVGDAADVFGGFGEAAGSIFDALGGLGDLF